MRGIVKTKIKMLGASIKQLQRVDGENIHEKIGQK